MLVSLAPGVQVALEINDVPSLAARGRAEELLAYLGLGDRLDSLPFMLSGGQQQRVAIVVTHDHRSLDVFDRVLEMEDGLLRARCSRRQYT